MLMERKLRVLQSLGSLGIGGNELFVMNLFRNMDKEKFQVDFIIYDDSRMNFYDEVIAAGGKVYVCKSNIKNKFLRTFSESIKTFKLLKKTKYSIIHCHNCSFLGIMRGAVPGKMISGVKVISHAHSVGSPRNTYVDTLLRKILKLFLSRMVDYGFACSDLAGESKYTETFLKSDRYIIVNNAVDVEKFSYNEATRNQLRGFYGIDNKMVIGTVGRLSEEKNHQFLIKVFSAIKKVRNDATLLIVGGGDLERKLRETAETLGVSSDVVFTGMVDNPQDYYSAMDVFVMTSLYEGLPFTVIEAQMNGLKCVLADTITKMSNVSGDVEFCSLDEHVEKWVELVLQKANARSDEEKIQLVRDKYDLKSEVKKIEEIYER